MYNQTLRSLSPENLQFYAKRGRLIVVGDIHGMRTPLHNLLHKVHYDPKKDVFVHVGDFLSRGPVPEALVLLSEFARNDTLGVRGNQDQPVIEWRAYFEWVRSKPNGKKWLESYGVFLDDGEDEGDAVRRRHLDSDGIFGQRSRKKQPPKYSYPSNWKWGKNHWDLAQKISYNEYKYLLGLPLILHLAPVDTHVVHAGLLPLDPTQDVESQRQPLARVPRCPDESETSSPPNITMLRTVQELEVATNITQNTVPWNVMNIRSILRDGTITRSSKEGVPWADFWNLAMGKCIGFVTGFDSGPNGRQHAHIPISSMAKGPKIGDKIRFPCHPFTVIYGHAASRGLDIKPWTKGLDSGCVYGRRLSAFVYTPKGSPFEETEDIEDEVIHGPKVKFGDNPGDARIVSVAC